MSVRDVSPPSADGAAAGAASTDRGLLRRRHPGEHHRVDFVELFFDLVFVFAVTQISHSLIEHLSLPGAIQTALLTVAVWWVWIYTTWVTNWLDPAKLPVRLALLALILPGLILSSSIPQAFGARGAAFAGAYVAMQVGRTAFFIWAVKGHPSMVRNFQRIVVWLLAGAFWMAGAFVDPLTRLAVWAVALGLEFISPSVGFWVPGLGCSTTADWQVEGGHMAERCGLFMIIALGESLLVTGATFADMTWTAATLAAFVVALVGSLAMWWLYFDTSAEVGTRTISRSADPGRIARLVYTYIHLPLVAGVILSAVGDELVLGHPLGHADAVTVTTVLGGSAIFLVGNALFRWAILRRLPWPHLVGIAALGVLTLTAFRMPPLAVMTTGATVLLAIAAWDAKDRRRAADGEFLP